MKIGKVYCLYCGDDKWFKDKSFDGISWVQRCYLCNRTMHYLTVYKTTYVSYNNYPITQAIDSKDNEIWFQIESQITYKYNFDTDKSTYINSRKSPAEIEEYNGFVSYAKLRKLAAFS